MYFYSETEPSVRYRYQVEKALGIFCSRLDLANNVRLHFVVQEQSRGAYQFTKPVHGFCCRGEVYILRDLTPAAMVETVAHESRHAWQYAHDRFLFPLELAERDARLFVYGQELPRRDRDVLAWLDREEREQLARMLQSYSRETATPSKELTRLNYYQPKVERRMAV